MRFAIQTAFLLMATAFFSGCGVRGRPQPPLEPAELGRGKPSFTRADQQFAVPNVPSPEASPTPIESEGEDY